MSLARDLGASGQCPNLAGLSLSSLAHSIQAELPELSPVNWTSFFTACGPEEHGVFGFTAMDPESYALSITDFRQVQAPTIFDRLSQSGLMSKVVNLPNTYPAQPLRGMLIAGFVAPDLYGAVYPKILASMLESKGYKLEADTEQGRRDFNLLFSELHATLRSRRQALDLLWPDLAWDLFVCVLTETDRLGHFLFPAIEDEKDPWHGACMHLLQEWDKLIGEILERFEALPEPKRLLVLADHGFTTLRTEVDINAWLKARGLLKPGRKAEHELDAGCIHPESKALALDPGRILLHDGKRFARGGLRPSAARNLIEEIRYGLLDMTWEGEAVMAEVHRGQDLYPGCPFALCPDLVCEPNPGFDLKAKFDREEIFGTFGRRGTHTAQDVFCYDSQGASIERVRDVGKEVLEFWTKAQQILV